jgi:hypothetical protein
MEMSYQLHDLAALLIRKQPHCPLRRSLDDQLILIVCRTCCTMREIVKILSPPVTLNEVSNEGIIIIIIYCRNSVFRDRRAFIFVGKKTTERRLYCCLLPPNVLTDSFQF